MSSRSARAPGAGRRSSGGSFLLGVFVGLILGLGVALGIAFYLNKTPIPFLAKTKPADKPGAKPPAIAGMPQGAVAAAAPADKPKFDFYKILPGAEEPVSEKELKDRARAARAQPEAGKEIYFIQTGAFQNPADADNQKARLAILGLESSVEPTAVPERGTWYRVRLGPYTRVDDLNRVRQTLTQNGIPTSLVKVKDPKDAKP